MRKNMLFLLTIIILITPTHLFAQILEYHPEVDTLLTNTTAEPYFEWTVNNNSSYDSLSLQVYEMPDRDYPSVFNSTEIQGDFDNFYLLIENNENELSYKVQYSINSPDNDFQDIHSDSFYYIDHPGFVYFKFVVLIESERADSVMLVIEQQFGLSVEDEPHPDKFSLSQNYPNPFNPETFIPFQLPEKSDVRLEVFDMLGRRVAVLLDDILLPSTHLTRFDASGLASGVYIYRITAGDFVQTKQMVLVK